MAAEFCRPCAAGQTGGMMRRWIPEIVKTLWAAIAICVCLTASFVIVGSRDDHSGTAWAQMFTTCQANPPFAGPCVGPDGWTQFVPSTTDAAGNPATGSCAKSGATYTGSCIFYYADAAHGGNDSNACFSTPPIQQNFALPCLTPSVVSATYMRNGFPDWALALKGSSFFSSNEGVATVGLSQPNKKGRSCTEPMVFGSYGTGARPIFNIANDDPKTPLWNTSGGSTNGSYTAITGLYAYGYQRDTAVPANFSNTNLASANSTPSLVNGNTSVTCIWLEDNEVTNGVNMIQLQQTAVSLPPNSNIFIRRNIVGHAFGAFGAPNCSYIAVTNTLLVEENFFDTCGLDKVAGALNSITYAAASTTFTWQNSPFYLGWTNASIECLTTEDGITAGTRYFIAPGSLNVGAQSFELSVNSSGTPLLTTTGNTGSGTQQCYVPQFNPTVFAHSIYEHAFAENGNQTSNIMRGNFITNDSSQPNWRSGGIITDNFIAYSGGPLQTYSYAWDIIPAQVTWNVTTKLIAGGVIPGSGRPGTGALVGQNTLPIVGFQIATGQQTTAGEIVNIQFVCSNLSVPNCNFNETVQYTIPTTGTSIATITAALVTATATHAPLVAYGIIADNTSTDVGNQSVEFSFVGPLSGQVAITAFMSNPASTTLINYFNGNFQAQGILFDHNLVFNYDSTDSTTTGTGISIGQPVTTVTNNTVCNWGPSAYTDRTIPTVAGGASSNSGTTTRLSLDSQFLQIQGQGPVTISGVAAYLNGPQYAKWVSNSTIDVYVAYQAVTFSAGTVTTNPYVPNVNTGNRFGTGTSTPCSGITSPPASNAANITMGQYMQQIGLGATCATPNSCVDQDLINAWYGQSKDNWNPALRPCAMNDIGFRSPFNMTLHNDCPTFSELDPDNDNGIPLLMTG